MEPAEIKAKQKELLGNDKHAVHLRPVAEDVTGDQWLLDRQQIEV